MCDHNLLRGKDPIPCSSPVQPNPDEVGQAEVGLEGLGTEAEGAERLH